MVLSIHITLLYWGTTWVIIPPFLSQNDVCESYLWQTTANHASLQGQKPKVMHTHEVSYNTMQPCTYTHAEGHAGKQLCLLGTTHTYTPTLVDTTVQCMSFLWYLYTLIQLTYTWDWFMNTLAQDTHTQCTTTLLVVQTTPALCWHRTKDFTVSSVLTINNAHYVLLVLFTDN